MATKKLPSSTCFGGSAAKTRASWRSADELFLKEYPGSAKITIGLSQFKDIHDLISS
jgi:hypothetical protein